MPIRTCEMLLWVFACLYVCVLQASPNNLQSSIYSISMVSTPTTILLRKSACCCVAGLLTDRFLPEDLAGVTERFINTLLTLEEKNKK